MLPRSHPRGAAGVLAAICLAVSVAASLVARPAQGAAQTTPDLAAPPIVRAATGYWLVAADGGVFSYGDAEFAGSMGGTRLAAPVVASAGTPTGRGYWMAARDGGVFAFGDAAFLGSMGGAHLNKPIVGMAATPSGKGYWLVASDGGIFAFGDALFAGSTGAMALNKPIVGMAPTASGNGYFLVASDGGIFTFGDAAFYGSTGSMKLNAPIVAMTATPAGKGYWLVATDGGIFTFGDAAFHGSTGAMKLNKPIVAIAQTGFGGGYWLVASDGGIFSFGDASFYGSAGDIPLASPVVTIATRPKPGPVRTAAFYYPWYASTDVDGRWRHWDDADPTASSPEFAPPELIASNYFPARGPYSSASAPILDAQMAELAASGVDTVVISWWGRGSFEDSRLAGVVNAARARGLTPAVHIEPYANRSPETVAQDVDRLAGTFGIDEVWIYLSDDGPPENWRVATDSFPGVRFWGHSHLASNAVTSLFGTYATRAGFDGVYTYDALPYSPDSFARVCAQARARHLLCSPSVNPGYDDTRIRPSSGERRSRVGGDRYDNYWRGAFRASPDVVSITSYNEWHEGTQIEPAVAKCVAGTSCYENYDGAYGRGIDASPTAYLDRTRAWVDALTAAVP